MSANEGKRPAQEQLEQLWNLCRGWIDKLPIRAPESIYQCDWVSEGSLEFIEDICGIVGYFEEPKEQAHGERE